jgi:hypothetical protein
MKKTKLMLEIEERFGENLGDLLRRKYPEENTVKIGEELGATNATIGNWLKKCGIKIRSISEARLPASFVEPTKEEMERMYVIEEKTTYEIGEKLGISSNTVARRLKGYGIEIRNKSGKYDDKEYRRKCVDELVEFIGKKAEELSTSDLVIKKKDRISCGGVLDWYQRKYNLNTGAAREMLIWDLYGRRAKRVSKKGIYDDKEYRRKCIDELLEKIGKKPEELSTNNFKTKNKYGICFVGVIGWYMRKNNCKISSARDKLVEDLYGAKKVPQKDWFESVLKEYVGAKQ